MTTVVPAGSDLNHWWSGRVTSEEQSAAMASGGETLGPEGGGNTTAPPESDGRGGTVVGVVDVVDVGGCVDVVPFDPCVAVVPCAVGVLGELEQDATTAAVPNVLRSSLSPLPRRKGCTRGRLS